MHADVVYLLDACQSVGQLPVDVQSIGCHFLTGTGRKYLRAPRGSGFLYVSPRILRGADPALPAGIEPAALDVRGGTWLGADQYSMHATARRYEEYEMSFAAKVRVRQRVCRGQCVSAGLRQAACMNHVCMHA